MNRHGESGNHPDRSKRVFKQDGYWYYKTREGIDIGPFDSKTEADEGVSQFIDFVLHAEPSVLQSLSNYALNSQLRVG